MLERGSHPPGGCCSPARPCSRPGGFRQDGKSEPADPAAAAPLMTALWRKRRRRRRLHLRAAAPRGHRHQRLRHPPRVSSGRQAVPTAGTMLCRTVPTAGAMLSHTVPTLCTALCHAVPVLPLCALCHAISAPHAVPHATPGSCAWAGRTSTPGQGLLVALARTSWPEGLGLAWHRRSHQLQPGAASTVSHQALPPPRLAPRIYWPH